MQCLSFCLFGVYGADKEGHIQVQNQDNCKTNCPACSRVCPEAAIMFPKYKAGPINGDVVKDEDLQREKMKVDISALLGGDIYSMLRMRTERAQSRFSKERDSDKALNERQKCLTKLAQAGDIPAEVGPLEADGLHRVVGLVPGFRQDGAEGGHAEHPAAGGDDPVPFPPGSCV